MNITFIIVLISVFMNTHSACREIVNSKVHRKMPTVDYGRRFSCKCGIVNDGLESRIVGGKKFASHKYPWLAQVYRKDKFHCGGTTINNRYIMTAGHCAMNEKLERLVKNTLLIILGVDDILNKYEPSRQFFNVENIILPQAFYSDYLHDVHDIALFKLDRSITFTRTVSPACLPPDNTFTYSTSKGIIAGWGTQSYQGNASQYPLEAFVNLITDSECSNVSVLGEHFLENPQAMFCAYSGVSDACQGDSGGPLILEEPKGMTVIGIISWGIKCGMKGIPGVYTRVSYYLDWILKHTADAQYC